MEAIFKGCLIGGAIGDALGAPIEFYSLKQIRANHGKEGITDYVEYENNKGEFTDDTQMTLFTADALLRANPNSNSLEEELNTMAHQSYLRWLQTQKKDIEKGNFQKEIPDGDTDWLMQEEILYRRRAPGNTCISALMSGQAGKINNPINDSKGCGTIMRVAPIGLFFGGNSKKAFEVACHFSAITHGHPSGYLSAGFFAGVLSDLTVGIDLLTSIDNTLKILENWNYHEETFSAVHAAIDLFGKTKLNKNLIEAEIIENLGDGWIAEEALAMSLFASLIFENDFKNGVLFSVNHGGDSDSTGSITGNILGLINGIDQIPLGWKTNLIGYSIVNRMAENLYSKIR